MGCDIHMYVEYRNDNNWRPGDYFVKDGDWADDNGFERKEIHGGRNYSLFSTLAGVRDYSEKIVPVSEPKGIPDDACRYTKKQFNEWGSDAHTPSYLTLSELKAYQDGHPVLHHSGLISPKQQVDLDNGVLPDSWCQGTSLEGYKRREWSEPNTALIPLIEKLQVRAKELLRHEWEKQVPNDDHNIRIVFWFDN